MRASCFLVNDVCRFFLKNQKDINVIQVIN